MYSRKWGEKRGIDKRREGELQEAISFLEESYHSWQSKGFQDFDELEF